MIIVESVHGLKCGLLAWTKAKPCLQDPTEVLDEYGADALRLYLINSPVVRGETLRFKKEGVFAVVKDVFLPWYNAYRFLVQNVLRLQQQTGIAFEPAKVQSSWAWQSDESSHE